MNIIIALLITAFITAICYPIGRQLGARLSTSEDPARTKRWTVATVKVGLGGVVAICAWAILDGKDLAVLAAIVGVFTAVQVALTWRRLRHLGDA
jgi:hypothetical protein